MNIRNISKDEREEIEKYLVLDEDLLYSLIPPYVPEYKNYMFAPEGQIEAGKKKFQEIRHTLYEKICNEWDLCNKIDDPALNDTINIVAIVGDTISTIVVGIPPILLASILVKIGLRKFCSCSKKRSNLDV